MAKTLILFKAQLRGDNRTGDLFDTVVTVGGYTNQQGTYVPPHPARRKKRAEPAWQDKPQAAGAARDERGSQTQALPKDAGAQEDDSRLEPEVSGFTPTHELPDGTLVTGHPEEEGVWVDAQGDEYEDDYATPLQAGENRPSGRRGGAGDAQNPAPRAPQQKAAVAEAKPRPARGLDAPAAQGAGVPVPVTEFGAPQGASKKDRRQMNARAVELIDGQDSFTAEEKVELAKYSGQGGVGDSLNEYYTRPDVAAATWSVLRTLGLEQGEVLEPSCGTGVFLAASPDGVRVTGVELDGVSSRIAQALHDRHEVAHNSLERFATSDPRLFHGVVGNAPFGVRGETLKDDKPDLPTAEQYFLDTAIDKTRADGIVALIVPTGIMDGKNARAFRERILRKAELVGAHRLPNTAFSHSHTGVTSDLVIFRRRAPDVAQALGTVPRDTLKRLGIWDEEFIAGNYFAGRGAENIYGTPEDGWRAKAGLGNDFTVSGDMHGVADAIAGWVPPESGPAIAMPQLLDALDDDEADKRRAVNAALKPAYEVAEVGDTKTVNGVTYVLQGEPPRWHRAEGEEHPALEDARELAEQIDQLAAGDGKGAGEVSTLLDKFIEAHGNPHAIRELKAEASQDPRLWRLLAAVDKHGAYSDLITGRQREKGNSFDAVATRLSHDKGGFTADEVADYWTGGDREAVLDHLFASPGYALEADGRTWTTVDDYLSGNLWGRLDAVTEALAHEGLTENYRTQYQRQVDALEKAIDRKPLEEVEIVINSGWLPLDALNAWQADVLKAYQEKNPGSGWARDLKPATFEYIGGIYQVSGGLHETELLAKYLNRTGVRKDDMPRIEELNQAFRNWLLTSEHRERVEELYNRTFRGQVDKAYSQTPLQVPGLNPDIDINPYHWANLRWALDRGKGILAPDVGLGKTFEGLTLARMMKASGQAKKPVIVVPKSVLSNWAAEIEFFFPGSRVMMVGETVGENGKSRADTKADRDRKLHEIAQSNSFDFILISQSAFDDIDLDPVTKKEYHDNDFWVQRGDKLGNAGDKRTKRIREAFKQEIARREVTQRTDAIYFNDLGVDALIGDEFHAYKNLYAARSRFGDTPRFLGGSGLSDRAMDVNYKARWLLNQNEGRNVYALTATPTKNSPLEIYSMLSHVAPELWEQSGIKNAEDFLDRYALFEEGTYLGTSGEIATGLITVGFKNMDELRGLMSRYILRQTAADVGLKIPARDEHRHMIDMSAQQEAVYQELREKAEQGEKDDEGGSHIFRIMSDMAKVALDPELYDKQRFKGARSPKLEAAAEKIATGAKDGGQVVFADHNGVHEKLAGLIAKRGIPREKIGIINGEATKSAASRQKIADAFNRGDLSVVIGNTGVMGEGLNLQKETTDSHDLDIPWDPASLQQRHGRSVRQKNRNEVVRMHTYLAKGSFDGYRYQTMAAKRDWQHLIWNGGDRIENLAREGAVSREDMLIMLSADPEAARKAITENKSLQQERQAAAGRAEAAGRFVKFQEMSRGYHSLKNKGTPSAAKLKERIDRERAALRAHKWFLGKEALDLDKPVVVQPETGHVWREGKGLELEGGNKGPINWSSEPSRWVVTAVDPVKGTVKARRYGQIGERDYEWDIGKMAHGVKEVEYDQAKELASISQAQAELANTKAAGATSLKDVVGMDHDKLRKLAPKVQQALKEAARGYKDRGWSGPVPMLDKEGSPVAFTSYRARDQLDNHDLMLPLPENREKAMQAWMQAEKGKAVVTRHNTSRGRTKAAGHVLRYKGFGFGSETGNPWNSIGRELFGGGFVTDAQQKLREEAKAAIAGAETLQDAVAAAQWTVHDTWSPRIPPDIRQLLLEKAKDLGVADKPISEALTLSAHRGVHPGLFGLQDNRAYNDEWHSIERVLRRAS